MGRVGVVVGEATGKGMPAALVVSATSNMLRAVAQALCSSSPGEILAWVDETLFARITSNMFVTCFYAILYPKEGRWRKLNGAHLVALVRAGAKFLNGALVEGSEAEGEEQKVAA